MTLVLTLLPMALHEIHYVSVILQIFVHKRNLQIIEQLTHSLHMNYLVGSTSHKSQRRMEVVMRIMDYSKYGKEGGSCKGAETQGGHSECLL